MAEADRFVEMDGVGEAVIGFEIEAVSAHPGGFGDGVLENGAADPSAAVAFFDGHLGNLIDTGGYFVGDFKDSGSHFGDLVDLRLHGDEGTSPNRLFADLREEDVAAFVEDLAGWIVEGFAVFVLDTKVLRDPLLVKGAKGLLVAGLEPSQENVLASARGGEG